MSAAGRGEAADDVETLMPTNTDAAIAVMAVEMRYVRKAVDEIKQNQSANVTRSEWQQRNAHVDGRFADVYRELAARRVSWPAVGALVVAAIVLVLDLISRNG
jgi:hypothetical protein